MILDREFQYKILISASEVYPAYTYPDDNNGLINNSDQSSHKKLAANLKYLEEHQLIQPKAVIVGADNRYSFGCIQITNKGMDFLANDGGLSAILNVVTVKFEADTLKAILENRINQSDLTPDDKKSMIDSLRELPAESIKHLTMKLLDEGLENLPSAILLIGTYLGMS